jgi:3'(2'), 5'-bisphosphate nucleotidase
MEKLPDIAAVDAIARAAGEEILKVYAGSDFGARSKSDDSPLTEADLRAHHLIVARLPELLPGVPVLSEESSDVAYEVRRHWLRYWLVDPLDGTKEFLSRNGEFTVNIALIDHGCPVLGVVHVPVSGDSYWGAVGVPAAKCSAAGAVNAIRTASQIAAPARVVGSRSHRGASLDRFLGRLGSHEFVSMGSSLKFCLVADGRADVYPRLGPTSEWDTAAAQAVVEAAGGAVLTLGGERLPYNGKRDYLNPHFIVTGCQPRHWLELLA